MKKYYIKIRKTKKLKKNISKTFVILINILINVDPKILIVKTVIRKNNKNLKIWRNLLYITSIYLNMR